jgi:hypothetical protein
MSEFSRDEMEEMVRRWIAANDEAGASGDWSEMPNFYTEDAVYSWNNGSNWEFVARGRKQIAEWVFGSEMSGLENWTYPYVRTLIDDRKGELIGIWRQVAPVKDSLGKPYEIRGTGGSWFRYAGDFKWEWQRDFFDHMNAGAVFGAMAKNNQLSPRMVERMKKGSDMPGWIRVEEFDWMAGINDIES